MPDPGDAAIAEDMDPDDLAFEVVNDIESEANTPDTAVVAMGCTPGMDFVRVEFEMGCPTRLSLRHGFSGMYPVQQQVAACLVLGLGNQRWDCAMPTACATVEWDMAL